MNDDRLAIFLEEKILNISVNSMELFFNVFMKLPKNRKFPENECNELLIQLVAFGCFSSLNNLSFKENNNYALNKISIIINNLSLSSINDKINDLYNSLVEEIFLINKCDVKNKTIDLFSLNISHIHKSFKKNKYHLDKFLDMYWNRTQEFIDLFYNN